MTTRESNLGSCSLSSALDRLPPQSSPPCHPDPRPAPEEGQSRTRSRHLTLSSPGASKDRGKIRSHLRNPDSPDSALPTTRGSPGMRGSLLLDGRLNLIQSSLLEEKWGTTSLTCLRAEEINNMHVDSQLTKMCCYLFLWLSSHVTLHVCHLNSLCQDMFTIFTTIIREDSSNSQILQIRLLRELIQKCINVSKW